MDQDSSDGLATLADLDAESAADAAAQGDFAAAVSRARSAVSGYRDLAAAEPEVFRPDLAATLDALSDYLARVGQRTAALDASDEAVAIFRDLAGPAAHFGPGSPGYDVIPPTADPRTRDADASAADMAADDDAALFVPYLAAALSNLAVRQHEAEQDTAALESAREAVALYRGLGEAEGAGTAVTPVAGAASGFLPDHVDQPGGRRVQLHEYSTELAMALSNLMNRLDDAGDGAAALAAADEVAGIYQQLAATEPARFVPLLAQTSNNRAVLLRQSGQNAPAISATRQAVNLYRSLAAGQPEEYQDYLAMVLGNLANMLQDAGRSRDALPVAQEVVDLYRQLADRSASAQQRDPAGDAQSAANGDAGAPATDAAHVAVAPGAASDNPYDAPLAMALNNLAARLAAAHRGEEALAATREASRLYRKLSRTNPAQHLGNLAATLTNLGSDLAEAGHTDEALSATREAVDVTRRLAFSNRNLYLPQLALAVETLARRQQEADRVSGAIASAREASRLYEELAQRDPDAHAEGLARARELAELLRHASAQG